MGTKTKNKNTTIQSIVNLEGVNLWLIDGPLFSHECRTVGCRCVACLFNADELIYLIVSLPVCVQKQQQTATKNGETQMCEPYNMLAGCSCSRRLPKCQKLSCMCVMLRLRAATIHRHQSDMMSRGNRQHDPAQKVWLNLAEVNTTNNLIMSRCESNVYPLSH